MPRCSNLRENSTDLNSFLHGLQMRLLWKPFDAIALPRIVQLINKTNQFNLTTRRYTEAELAAMMTAPDVLTAQFRLIDRLGDNGIIALVIGRLLSAEKSFLDTWLMSCRVLGRQVEESTLFGVIAARTRALGVRRIIGEYRPTAKNGIVREHYRKAGFTSLPRNLTVPAAGCSIRQFPGKIRRSFLSLRLHMQESQIYSQLTDIFHNIFDDDAIALRPDLTARDVPGWDSLTHINLVVAAEFRFRIKFRAAELESLQNVGHFVQLISQKLQAAN